MNNKIVYNSLFNVLSEWLLLKDNFSAISWRWDDDDDDDDDVHFVLDQHQYHLIFIASSLKQLSISLHSDTLYMLPSQPIVVITP